MNFWFMKFQEYGENCWCRLLWITWNEKTNLTSLSDIHFANSNRVLSSRNLLVALPHFEKSGPLPHLPPPIFLRLCKMTSIYNDTERLKIFLYVITIGVTFQYHILRNYSRIWRWCYIYVKMLTLMYTQCHNKRILGSSGPHSLSNVYLCLWRWGGGWGRIAVHLIYHAETTNL